MPSTVGGPGEAPGSLWYPGQNYTSGRAGHRIQYICIHGTGWPQPLDYWIANYKTCGVTYMVGKDGRVAQFVAEADTHWGNGRLDEGHVWYWGEGGKYRDPNQVSVSIEHEKHSKTNTDVLTPQQQAASFALVRYLVQKYNIKPGPADEFSGILPHSDISPAARWYCPGPYPWDALWDSLKGVRVIPLGWKDDGKTLTAPNGVPVVKGFRAYVLTHAWEADDLPLEAEANSEQYFTKTKLVYSTARGVERAAVGSQAFVLRPFLAALGR